MNTTGWEIEKSLVIVMVLKWGVEENQREHKNYLIFGFRDGHLRLKETILPVPSICILHF
jgi:hypothetical protein